MILSVNRVIHFLMDRGLIDPDAVIDGDLIVVEASSRNRNFKIIRKHVPGFFIKQVQQLDPQSTRLLEREASCYWLAANDPGFAVLASNVPQFAYYDPKRHFLVMELVLGGEDLKEYHRRLGTFPQEVAAYLGEAIGAYHQDITLNAINRATSTAFPRTVPWILSAHRQNQTLSQSHRGANQQILSIIHQYSDFHSYLDALHETWQFDTFIHGDMKWENCIVYPVSGTQQVKIVDWETVDFGDACWDVGAIFQAYLIYWIMSMSIQGQSLPFEYVSRAPFPLKVMQPAIRAFWLAYVRRRGLTEAEQPDILKRSISYGAARMLQTAFEYMHYSPQITVNAVSLLQVSLNILSDPQNAAQDLLGL